MIKVCHITSVHKWNDTRIFFKECISLSKAGYAVTLIAPNAIEGVTNGVTVVSVRTASKSRLMRATVVSAKCMHKAFQTKAAIFHFHDPELIWVGLFLKLFGKKVIFDIHENISAQLRVKKWLPARRTVSKIYKIFDWIAVKSFYLILAENSYLPIYQRWSNQGKTEIILNLPDVVELEKMALETTPHSVNGILYIGGVTKERGIFEVIQAINLLKQQGVILHFHCIGPLEHGVMDHLEEMYAFQQIKECVTFYGQIPVYEAYKKARLCKVGISILHPIENYLYSYSTKVFEYMAVGLPCVVSDFELYRFIEEKEVGLLADPLNPQSIADQIHRLLADEDLWKRLSKNGKVVAKTAYSWESQELKLLNFYQKILRKSRNSLPRIQVIDTLIKEQETVRICHFTSAHYARDVRIFHKECVSLAEAGFEVYLVAANVQEETVKGVHVVSADAPVSGRISRILKTSRSVYKKALHLDAAIYHFHDPELLPYALKLKRRGKKVIYDAHEDVPRQISGKDWIAKWIRGSIAFIFEKYENYVAKRLVAVVTSTPVIANRFLQVNANTVSICNYPILEEITSPSEWTDRKSEICYVGGITVIRGIKELIAALPSMPHLRLNLAGSYAPLALRDKLIAAPGWDQVNEYGFVDRVSIAEILNRSKVGIVTLYPQSNYLESLPIKMFEYMLAGIPVVASDFPLWRSIVDENECGVCADPLDPESIALAVNSLLKDDENAARMGANGRKAVLEKYNWGQQAYKLAQLYRNLLQN